MTKCSTGAPASVAPSARRRRSLVARDAHVIAESIPHIVWTASPVGVTTYFNRQGTDYTGSLSENKHGWKWITLVHPDDAERAKRAWEHATCSETDFALEYRLRRFDGVFRWHAFRARPLRDAAGEIQMWLGTATDIDDQKHLELSLRDAEREAIGALTLLQSIEASASVGFALVDRELRIIRINQHLARIGGLSVADHIGRTVADVVPGLWPQLEDLYRRALDGDVVSNIDISGPSMARPRRTHHWLASYYPVWVDGEIIGVGNVVVDITERKEAEQFRAVVMDNMAEGLCALDGNGLVTYSNPAASRMLGWTEDELHGKPMHETVHMQSADGTPIAAEDCALIRARGECRTVRMADEAFTRKDGSIFPVAYSCAPLHGGASVDGVVVVFRDITEEQEKRSSVQRELAALSWIGRIRDAMDEQRLVLYSQPIVPLSGGRPGVELLLRMVGRDGEVIQPGSFLPVAEKYGQIGEIDRWVVTQAIRLAAEGAVGVVGANLSAASIESSDLLALIERQLHETGADPANLVFELTETALMRDIAAGERFALGLRELGCGLALDDFGTGFGGFTYLKNLPTTYLKIDIEFVRDLVTNTANRHVVRAIVGLARAFGLQTIAEGVENEATLTLLRAEGVDFVQGFHVGRPAPMA
jgi:PAS domain S-box-containing protein